jgi:hypothetical protein
MTIRLAFFFWRGNKCNNSNYISRNNCIGIFFQQVKLAEKMKLNFRAKQCGGKYSAKNEGNSENSSVKSEVCSRLLGNPFKPDFLKNISQSNVCINYRKTVKGGV